MRLCALISALNSISAIRAFAFTFTFTFTFAFAFAFAFSNNTTIPSPRSNSYLYFTFFLFDILSLSLSLNFLLSFLQFTYSIISHPTFLHSPSLLSLFASLNPNWIVVWIRIISPLRSALLCSFHQSRFPSFSLSYHGERPRKEDVCRSYF